jgi:hypothetical protein
VTTRGYNALLCLFEDPLFEPLQLPEWFAQPTCGPLWLNTEPTDVRCRSPPQR